MRQLRVKLSFLLLLIGISISLQFDYLFFNIPFLPPFLIIISVFFIAFSLPSNSIDGLVVFLFFISALFLFALLSGVYDFSGLRRTIVYPGYIVLSVFVVNKLLYKTTFPQLQKIIKLTLFFCVAAVCIETFFRFSMPTLDLRSDVGENVLRLIDRQSGYESFLGNQYFYAFKFSSIMFFDSNFVGLFLLPLLVLNLFCLNFYKEKKVLKFLLVIILILIFLSFSRSAIITSIAILYFYFMYNLIKKNVILFLFIIFFSLSFGFFGLISFFDLLLQDDSFETKLSIIRSINKVVDQDLVHVLFGYGVDKGGTIYSYREDSYAHALIPLLLGQFGIVGVSIYFSALIYYSFKVGFFGWLLFFAIIFSGVSLADPWQVLNYFCFLIMAHFIRLNGYKKRGFRFEC